ncbi:MAG: Gfo/Idh/MocA family protein [Pirellulales bacterium]
MSMQPEGLTRRALLGLAASTLAAPAVVASSVLGREGATAPSERITLGVIGVGGRGSYDMHHFMAESAVQVLAVCDVQADRRSAAKDAVDGRLGNKDCQAYRDFRELLAREEIDAVLIATGDRWHSLVSILAAKAGKDVYCEKPMSLTIAEGRAVADTMRRYASVYQCGTQRRNDPRFAFAAETARSGKLGRLHTIHAYTPGFLRDIGTFQARPPQPKPAREILDWDLWLGPVPWRPYNSGYVGNVFSWSNVPDLGGGGITDWGTHQSDLAQFANDAERTSPVEYGQSNPAEVVTRYANGVKLVFHEGIPPGGLVSIRFEGSEGWISVDDRLGLEGDPSSVLGSHSARQRGDEEKPANHIQEFLDCIRTRRQPACNAEVAHRGTTACHITNLCLCLGRSLKWDPANEEFVGDEMANQMRSRALREPWRL